MGERFYMQTRTRMTYTPRCIKRYPVDRRRLGERKAAALTQPSAWLRSKAL